MPLEGVTVLDFGQFLSAPSATLRLSDLGARVIKVERPGTGDICRTLYISNCDIDGDSSLFHAINRDKQSIAIDLKDPAARPILERLIAKADVMVTNFRPGVAEHLGIDYDSACAINPRIVYGEITGYGKVGPWSGRPGQDLLVQSLSGACWLNGNADQPPTPMGLSVADLFAGQHLVQGILAGLVRVRRESVGAHVCVSLLESLLDAQFEVFTTYLNDGRKPPQRSSINNASAYIDAPYGIYATADGYLALAMIPIPKLGELLNCKELLAFDDPATWHEHRDEIKVIVADWLKRETTHHWLRILDAADVWCSDVYTWDKLFATDAFKSLDMLQVVKRPNGTSVATTRCPIVIDNERPRGKVAAPIVGQDNKAFVG
ncbi:CaiB/BaiF CoA transferase family protein [Olsenella phocaeensis]|uniref:CaiB/BaiF CoA transferase family protein n=1 Tax=Olsenella phocaeensis TaxID=1852385 RepID=UPI000A659AD4|nr:CaiB/BaiF CoA-transferase family protein [Olsenella phocaeensis]